MVQWWLWTVARWGRLGLVMLAALIAGCPRDPAASCTRYVACQRAWDAASDHAGVDTTDYGATGICWADPATAAQCGLECAQAVAAIAVAASSAGRPLEECE